MRLFCVTNTFVMNTETPIQAAEKCSVFDAVVACVGSQAALAARLGVTQQAVSWWRKSGVFPEKYCADIERITAGRVSRQMLRPSDWSRIWPELARAQALRNRRQAKQAA